MKLLLVCCSHILLDVGLPEREPLGGSESCMVYLARTLASSGHDVTLAARLAPGTPEHIMRVRHVPLELMDSAAFCAAENFDAVIALSAPAVAAHLKRVAPKAIHVAWLHMLPDQSSMAPLAAATPMIDCAVFVSNTQRQMVRYGGRSHVIGNGIAPAFENMFASAEDLRAAKQDRAAYTSMPYRGLHQLVQVIGQMKGETHFDIYSAMQTYREPDDAFAPLYDQVKAARRTSYHGAVAQSALAGELRNIAFLAYPCSFVETYCIAALEAIAAGLKVVSFDLGALRETTLGFADLQTLAPGMTDETLLAAYTALLEKNAADFRQHPQEWAQQRFEQSQAVNRICSWSARAREWEKFLGTAMAARA